MTTVIRSAVPVKRKITLKRNADWHQTIYLRENDRVTPKDTTDYGMTLTIKSSPDGETYKTLSIDSGITHTPAQGQFQIELTAEEIALFTFVNAVYEVIITNSSDRPSCPFYGSVELIP